jgi:hypothetical protein
VKTTDNFLFFKDVRAGSLAKNIHFVYCQTATFERAGKVQMFPELEKYPTG